MLSRPFLGNRPTWWRHDHTLAITVPIRLTRPKKVHLKVVSVFVLGIHAGHPSWRSDRMFISLPWYVRREKVAEMGVRHQIHRVSRVILKLFTQGTDHHAQILPLLATFRTPK